MEISQLKYFVAITDYGSMVKAAEALHTSQPNLSISIRRLEDSVGFKLFSRESGMLKLTKGGEVFLLNVRNALNILNEGAEAGMLRANSQVQRVNIATTVREFLPRHISEYIMSNPDISIGQFTLSADEIEKKLINGEVDFAVTYHPIRGHTIEWRPLAQSDICLMVGSGHPLAGHGSVTLRELRNEHFICGDSSNRIITREICDTVPFIPNIVYETEERSIQDALLSAGRGVQFIPEMDVRRELFETCENNIRLLSLPDCPRKIEIGICQSKREMSRTAEDMLDAVCRKISEIYSNYRV